jgi:hypothetical protein
MRLTDTVVSTKGRVKLLYSIHNLTFASVCTAPIFNDKEYSLIIDIRLAIRDIFIATFKRKHLIRQIYLHFVSIGHR